MTINEKIKSMCAVAFEIGHNQTQQKQISQEKLKKDVWFFRLRRGYFHVVWAAYKAGLFARDRGDE